MRFFFILLVNLCFISIQSIKAQPPFFETKDIQKILLEADSSTQTRTILKRIWINNSYSEEQKIALIDSLANRPLIKSDQEKVLSINQFGDSLCKVIVKKKSSFDLDVFIANFNFRLGELFYYRTNYKLASQKIDIALKHYKNVDGSEERIAQCYNIKAVISCEQGDYDEGIRLFYKSEKVHSAINNISGAANARMNIALTYKTLGERDKAISEFHKVIKMLDDKNDKRQLRILGGVYNNLGGLYTDMGKYDLGLSSLSKALRYRENLGDSLGLASVYVNLGSLYEAKGDLDKQLKYFQKGYITYTKFQMKSGIAFAGIQIARTKYSINPNDPDIKRLAEEAIAIATENKIAETIQEASNFLQQYYRDKGDFEKAYKYLWLSKSYKDSILSDQNRNELFRQQNKYEYEKKKAIDDLNHANNIEREHKKQQTLYIIVAFSLIIIALFWISFFRKQKDNKKLKELNEKLNASEQSLKVLNASKDKFFAIISHDLRNPLAAFKNTAKMMIQADDKVSDLQIKEYIEDIKGSADQMSDLTEKLLSWARSQAGLNEPNKIEVDLGVVGLKAMLFAQHQAKENNIHVNCTIKENSLVHVDLDMISTVFRNLLSNAIKFTNENGSVEISANEFDTYYEVVVHDSGIGIAKEDIDKLFKIESDHKSIGNSSKKGSGLGLILCKEFIERNGGQIWVESQLGSGTSFYFTLPKI